MRFLCRTRSQGIIDSQILDTLVTQKWKEHNKTLRKPLKINEGWDTLVLCTRKWVITWMHSLNLLRKKPNDNTNHSIKRGYVTF